MPSAQGLGFQPVGSALSRLPVSPPLHQARFPCTCNRHGQMSRMHNLQYSAVSCLLSAPRLHWALYPSAMHGP